MTLSNWIHGLWTLQLTLEGVLILTLVFKQTWKKFPLFSAYCGWSLIGDIAAYALQHHPRSYIQFYFVYETISVALALLLMYEIFLHIFNAHRGLRKLAKVSLRIVGGLLTVLGLIVILANSPIGQKGLAAGILIVEESYRILEVGLIAALFVFSGAFGLHWRRQVFGIVLGLGISAAVKLAAVAINPHSYILAGVLNVIIGVSYNLGLLVWIGYSLLPERVEHRDLTPEKTQLEQWNRAVMELIHQ